MSKLNWGMRACGVFLFWATTAVALPAQTFTNQHNFDGADGDEPTAGLVQGIDGNLYGTTQFGGANSGKFCSTGCGTVFKITLSGKLITLYSFCAQSNCTDGSRPLAVLIQATDGNFYGTTWFGGAHGGGTAFKITPSGILTTIYSFCSKTSCTDGGSPTGGLVQATNGNFYGTTQDGGAHGGGTVFKITPSGILTTIYNFCSQGGTKCTDGQWPFAGPIQAMDGDFYGTTWSGGANGEGTIFKTTRSGNLTILHSFGQTEGHGPYAGLVQATNGSIYGTTSYGGDNGIGTVFKITLSGELATLHSFCRQDVSVSCSDGNAPYAGLIQATDGNFYGTTLAGGSVNSNAGTIFKITPRGTLVTLYAFCAQTRYCADGEGPYGGLVQATNGKFYGTTFVGGANSSCNGGVGCGTVFSLSVGLSPFVKTLSTSGKVGGAVTVLGTDLTGATSVTFNGTAAAFTVVSGSEITTTVPTGATTGTVQVVTSGGTLPSNMPFRVTP
jgi:uncharacterized repeat protein (TIGR03803 family)